MNLYGEILEQPPLRFDYSSTKAKDTFSKRGLRTYGPYDSNLFQKDKIRCVVLYPKNSEGFKQIFVDGLTDGEGSFRGFRDFFKISLVWEDEISFSNQKEVNISLSRISSTDVDLVFVILPEKHAILYKEAKSKLLANGIPSQMITIESIKKSGFQYTLENISLASYAKVGGTPWTVCSSKEENNLILGVSRAQDKSKKYLVGFVTLFTNDGDFIFLNSAAPAIEWEEYIKGLKELIERSIVEYEELRGEPDNMIIHFHKKPSKREIESIENALTSVEKDTPYALVHLNEYSNFRLFDASHSTYVPPTGLKVSLSSHQALLLLDGRRRGVERRKTGVPRILDVRMDKRSTLEFERFPELVKQISDFSYINWRGFNAVSVPITLNYSKLIAKMVIDIGLENWNQVVAEGKLRDKSWFL